MSRWSARESPDTREGGAPASPGTVEPGSRGETQPVAALVAVMAVCLALSAYSVGLDRALPEASDRDRGIAKPTLERVTDAVGDGRVVDPDDLEAGPPAGPDGYEVNVTLSTGDRNWSAGPEPPETAESAARPVGVRLEPGRTRPGRLRVEVWT